MRSVPDSVRADSGHRAKPHPRGRNHGFGQEEVIQIIESLPSYRHGAPLRESEHGPGRRKDSSEPGNYGRQGWSFRETDGIDANMSQDANPDSSAGLEPVAIGAGAEDDLPAIVDILNDAIVNSNATLTTHSTGVAERRGWFESFSLTGPHRLLVARRGDHVLGYAASQPYRDHEGFRETVEVGIALDATSRGQGIGTALYRALFECLADVPVHVALAGIVLPNDASIALHRKLGFAEVGIFHEYAVKNGQYLSSIWMERRFPGH